APISLEYPCCFVGHIPYPFNCGSDFALHSRRDAPVPIDDTRDGHYSYSSHFGYVGKCGHRFKIIAVFPSTVTMQAPSRGGATLFRKLCSGMVTSIGHIYM